jgi:hypothetical protein
MHQRPRWQFQHSGTGITGSKAMITTECRPLFSVKADASDGAKLNTHISCILSNRKLVNKPYSPNIANTTEMLDHY